MPRWNSPLVVSIIVTLAYEIAGDFVSQWLRDNAADWVADFVATPWSSLVVLVVVFVALWVVQMRLDGGTSPEAGDLAERASPVSDSVDARVVKADSAEGRWMRAAVTFLTWLYRRDEWSGLSQEARVAEGAPEDYARKRLQQLGLGDLSYARGNDIEPEPWWQPPEHTLVSVGGTTARCVRVESVAKVDDGSLRVLDLAEDATRAAVLAFHEAEVTPLYESEDSRPYDQR